MSDENRDQLKKDERTNEMFETPFLVDRVQAPIIKAMRKVALIVDGPVQWFRGIHQLIDFNFK